MMYFLQVVADTAVAVLPKSVGAFVTQYQVVLATLVNIGFNFGLASLPTGWAAISNKLKVVSSFVSAFVIYWLLGLVGGTASADITSAAAGLIPAILTLLTGSAGYMAGRSQPGNGAQ